MRHPPRFPLNKFIRSRYNSFLVRDNRAEQPPQRLLQSVVSGWSGAPACFSRFSSASAINSSDNYSETSVEVCFGFITVCRVIIVRNKEPGGIFYVKLCGKGDNDFAANVRVQMPWFLNKVFKNR